MKIVMNKVSKMKTQEIKIKRLTLVIEDEDGNPYVSQFGVEDKGSDILIGIVSSVSALKPFTPVEPFKINIKVEYKKVVERYKELLEWLSVAQEGTVDLEDHAFFKELQTVSGTIDSYIKRTIDDSDIDAGMFIKVMIEKLPKGSPCKELALKLYKEKYN